MGVTKQVLTALTFASFVFPAMADTADMDGKPRLAIGGYEYWSPTLLWKAVPGALEYQTVWHDARWQFASKQDLDLFVANPEKYAAQYDGHCAIGRSQTRAAHKDTVDPEAFTIVNGKLYINHTKYWTKNGARTKPKISAAPTKIG